MNFNIGITSIYQIEDIVDIEKGIINLNECSDKYKQFYEINVTNKCLIFFFFLSARIYITA